MTSNQNIMAWKQSNPFQVKSLKSEGASFYLDNNPNNPMLSSLKVHWKNPESSQTYLVTYTFFLAFIATFLSLPGIWCINLKLLMNKGQNKKIPRNK